MENIESQINTLQNISDQLLEACTSAGIKILIAIVIYFVGKFLIKRLLKLYDKIKAVEALDVTVRNYIRTCLKAALYVVLAVSIVAELGVDMASVIAIIASCGVAISLAMQGSLSNLAGGLMLLIFRPFNVGDYIVAGGEEGTVRSISLFYTVLVTVDNRVISIPNGAMMNANITNATSEPLRRVDLSFNVSGDIPVKKVQATILEAIIATDKVLPDPAPVVEPLTPVPGGLTYTARIWAKTENYWDVYFELMREIPTALGHAGIPGPSTPVAISK